MKLLSIAGKQYGVLSFAFYLRKRRSIVLAIGGIVLFLWIGWVVKEIRDVRQSSQQLESVRAEVEQISQAVDRLRAIKPYPLPLQEEVPAYVKALTAGLYVVAMSEKQESVNLEGISFSSYLYNIIFLNNPLDVLQAFKRLDNPWVVLEKLNYNNGRTQIEVRVYYRAN